LENVRPPKGGDFGRCFRRASDAFSFNVPQRPNAVTIIGILREQTELKH
jgi:hypothetical protein